MQIFTNFFFLFSFCLKLLLTFKLNFNIIDGKWKWRCYFSDTLQICWKYFLKSCRGWESLQGGDSCSHCDCCLSYFIVTLSTAPGTLCTPYPTLSLCLSVSLSVSHSLFLVLLSLSLLPSSLCLHLSVSLCTLVPNDIPKATRSKQTIKHTIVAGRVIVSVIARTLLLLLLLLLLLSIIMIITMIKKTIFYDIPILLLAISFLLFFCFSYSHFLVFIQFNGSLLSGYVNEEFCR